MHHVSCTRSIAPHANTGPRLSAGTKHHQCPGLSLEHCVTETVFLFEIVNESFDRPYQNCVLGVVVREATQLFRSPVEPLPATARHVFLKWINPSFMCRIRWIFGTSHQG